MAEHEYNVKIVADSVNPVGNRLTTFELTYPRFVHSELMTHRWFSRNAASSRAIPTPKLIKRIEDNPVIPVWWGKNQKGMQANEELDEGQIREAKEIWLAARDSALGYSRRLRDLGLHKQLANRIIEPWMFITVLVSATEWDNWFFLRDTWPEGEPPGPAQPEIAWVAREMRKALDSNSPVLVEPGYWHTPLVETKDPKNPLYVSESEIFAAAMQEDGKVLENVIQPVVAVSAARCARISYLTHDGKRDLCKDFDLHHRLSTSGHWSPFEHPAQSLDKSERIGNFIGWKQYRKYFANEHYQDKK